jgi:hypothetical protein
MTVDVASFKSASRIAGIAPSDFGRGTVIQLKKALSPTRRELISRACESSKVAD